MEEMSIHNRDTEITKVTVHFDDGTSQDITQGAIMNFKDNELVMSFCHMSGADVEEMLVAIALAVAKSM